MKLPKVYEPSQYEGDIYALWEKSKAFAPTGAGPSFSIVVPPPNANANLHIGFALTMTLQDIAIRYHRLKGDRTLFVPGADHAGFETQAVFEKHLAKAGKSRFDFSREELYQEIWDFVAQNRRGFEEQFRKLGGSVDWEHFTFTLDEKIVKRAYQTFQKMWNEGLIYRGERLVNFCTFHGTAFADIEVEYKTEPGRLWYLRYPLTDGSGEVVVATTRPETMLGDTAVAVHPDDPRYKKFVGKTIQLPLVHREIPIIADDFVDRTFGTGAVKITPSHDPNDFAAGQRHALPKITVIDYEGKMKANTPEAYRGLPVPEARAKVVADLEEQGFLVKTEDHPHSVGHCYKCGTVIEPLLKDQWFVDMQPLAKPAIQALKAGKITFYPKAKQTQLIRYLEGLQDWNISRQIAWGIPIPAFQDVDNPDDWIYDERVDQEIIEVKGKTYRRDPDVFDTWFSSSSWPYATLDFPDSKDFRDFYPLSLMETGGEILYPWVSRMIMLGLYVTGEIPFHAVYIHGYVMAEDGSKMSKSLGNVVSAPEVIDRYGADALRMGIVAGRVPAVNRGYDARKVEEARNFCNKLWNVARFIEDVVGDEAHLRHQPEALNSADHWILERLRHVSSKLTADLDRYRFAEAYERLYHFVWDDLADWYVEASKAEPNKALLAYILETTLKLVHPFAPFLTETIWQTLAWEQSSLVATSQWPQVPAGNSRESREFEALKQIIIEVRSLTSSLKISNVALRYSASPLLDKHGTFVTRLARLARVEPVVEGAGSGLQLTGTSESCWLEVDDSVVKRYLGELASKRQTQEKLISQLKGRLANKPYVAHAPAAVVAQTREQLAGAEELLAALKAEAKRFVR